ncbi:MAG: MerR family transcriptional regulator [Methyloligellaceae bacterium]
MKARLDKMYTVKEIAKLSGISVRALHHYHDIGLLIPAHVGENRYRYYGKPELLRLQQILFYRELGVSLSDIANYLDDPDFDYVTALKKHRLALERKAQRYHQLIETIDRTIRQLIGETEMDPNKLYEGFSPEKQAAYEQELIETGGEDMKASIASTKAHVAAMTDDDMSEAMRELAVLETALADAMKAGVAADSPELAPLIERHNSWVSGMWGRPCDPEAYGGLAELYRSHPDFRKRYEMIGEGFTEFLTGAMKAYVTRQQY